MSETDNRAKVIRVKQVAEKLGLSAAAVWYRVNPKNRRFDANFPRPFKISANATGWLESEIDAYIAARAADRLKDQPQEAEK